MLMDQHYSPLKHFSWMTLCAGLAAASSQTAMAQDEPDAIEVLGVLGGLDAPGACVDSTS